MLPLMYSFSVSDLSPNIGIFWYFVIEVFDQFRDFFLIIFQLHTFSFVIPTAYKFMQVAFVYLILKILI